MSEITDYDARIEKRFPEIDWRKPIMIRSTVGGLACRLCIARLGFTPVRDRDRLYQTREEFDTHMRDTHDTQQHEN